MTKIQNLPRYLGYHPSVLKKLASGKDMGIHFGGQDGQVVGYIQDWENNATVIATPPVFKSGEEVRGFLQGLLKFVRTNYQQLCAAR
jgi:hypothetical protein